MEHERDSNLPALREGDVAPYQFDGRNIRIVMKDGECWFVAGDVAAELGYGHTPHLVRHLDEDEKGVHNLDTLGGGQETTLVSEPGLYRAIVQRRATKKMDEKLKTRIGRFQRWVYHDVLPSIRKTGSYAVQEAPQFDIPKSYAEALRPAADQSEQINKLQIANAEMQPKADFHDAVGKAINAQPIRDVAKVLGTGQNRMFKRLRTEKVLMADNKPYQRFIEEGYFRLVEKQFYDGNGESRTYTRTLVTGKGLAYLQKRFGPGDGASANV